MAVRNSPRRRSPATTSDETAPKIAKAPLQPGWRKWRIGNEERARFIQGVVVSSAVRVIGISIITLILLLLAWRLRALLLLVAVSIFVAALVHPFVVLIERRRIGHTTATLIVYVVMVLIAAGLGFIVFHPVYTSATRFANDLPNLVRQAQNGKGAVGHLVNRFHLAKYVTRDAPHLESAITSLGKPALAVGKTVVSGLASLVTIMFMSFFIVLEAPKLFEGALSIMTEERASIIRRTTRAMAHQVTGFMLGDFATSIIAGLVVFVTLEATSVPFATVLAIWVGLVDFLPLVGGLLAGVPTVAVAFLHSVPAGIVVLIVFLLYQQIENHVLYPIIVSRTVSLNPLFVLLAVLLGAETGGIIGSTFGAICGAILAVPAAGSIQVAGKEVFRGWRGEPAPEEAST